MSIFCTKCGNPMNDADMFCASCGARQQAPPAEGVTVSANAAQPAFQSVQNQYNPPEPYAAAPQEYQPVYTPTSYAPSKAPKKPKKGLFIGLGIGGAVIIAGVIVLIILLTGGLKQGTPEELFETTKNALLDSANSGKPLDEKYYDLVFEYHFAKPDKKNEVKYYLSFMMTSYTTSPHIKEYYGTNLTNTYTIEEVETISPYEFYNNYMDKEHAEIDISKIQEVRRYRVHVTTKGSTGNEYDGTETLVVVKVDGKWYLHCYI